MLTALGEWAFKVHNFCTNFLQKALQQPVGAAAARRGVTVLEPHVQIIRTIQNLTTAALNSEAKERVSQKVCIGFDALQAWTSRTRQTCWFCDGPPLIYGLARGG